MSLVFDCETDVLLRPFRPQHFEAPRGPSEAVLLRESPQELHTRSPPQPRFLGVEAVRGRIL